MNIPPVPAVYDRSSAQQRETLLSGGFGSRIYERADGWLRRVPLTQQAKEAAARQCRFLPHLASRLPVHIPAPSLDSDGSMIYPKVPGKPLQAEIAGQSLARDVGSFMTALHSIPVDDAIAWGVPSTNRTTQLLASAERSLPFLPDELQRPLRNWIERFVEMDHPDVLIHGDLWYENLLIDTESGRLTGVVDFDQASIGDPAWDLATQLDCGREFAEQIFDTYPLKDPAMWQRAGNLFALRPFEALEWSVQQRDAAEFEDSLRKLYLVGVLPDTGMIRTTTAPWLGTSAE